MLGHVGLPLPSEGEASEGQASPVNTGPLVSYRHTPHRGVYPVRGVGEGRNQLSCQERRPVHAHPNHGPSTPAPMGGRVITEPQPLSAVTSGLSFLP